MNRLLPFWLALLLSCISGAATAATPNGYHLSQRQLALLRSLLVDDLNGYLRGGDSMLGTDALRGEQKTVPIYVTLSSLLRRYSENELAADGQFRSHYVVFMAKMESVRKSALGSPILRIKDGQSTFVANFPSANGHGLSGLKRDDEPTVLCRVDGLVGQQLALADCSLADADFRSEVVDAQLADIERALGGAGELSKALKTTVLMAIAFEHIMPPNSTCPENPSAKDCRLAEVSTTKQMGKALQSAMQELREAGIRWRELVPEARDAGH